ncbi:MAG: Clp1/GlmU family protein, partial [candidate division NC10 bacterium]|nr:Clp1/GlmU family protein [candidate division NC10 bacterium]
MSQIEIDIPRPWQELNLDLRGLLMVVGKADVGKTTFARYLYERLSEHSRKVAYLDGDPGQSTLGPPCTLTLALAREGDQSFPPQGAVWMFFV